VFCVEDERERERERERSVEKGSIGLGLSVFSLLIMFLVGFGNQEWFF
jgi:hypothetical protein